MVVDDFALDLSHGARLLRRNPGPTTVVLATLAWSSGDHAGGDSLEANCDVVVT
jgi:hypothetical protein